MGWSEKRARPLGGRSQPRPLGPRPRSVAPLVAFLCLGLSGLAQAEPLSRREEAYVRAVGILLKTEVQRSKALRTSSGARGVRALYPGLDLARVAFPSEAVAASFAEARRRDRVPRQSVEQRGREVVVLRGSGLGNEGYPARALRAAWGASSGSPSLELEPTEEDPEPAARGEGSERRDGAVDPLEPVGRRSGYVRTEIVPLGGETTQPQTEGERSPAGRPMRRIPRPQPGAAGPTPTEFDASGQWRGEGAERLVFRLVRSEPDADHYELELRGFAQPTPPLRAQVVGSSVTLSDFEGKRRVVYTAQPDGRGGVVLRQIAGDTKLVPSRSDLLARLPRD